jgi:hypothetical protein
MTTTLPTAPDAPAWHDAVREDLHQAWNALDAAQSKLHRQMREYQQDADPASGKRYVTPAERRLRDFLADFDKMTAELILLVIDEIFPVPDEEPDGDPDDDLDGEDP